jgi:autoinducer 2-degrading protein
VTEAGAQGDSQTITLLVTMTFKPEKEAAFLEFAARFIERVQADEPGTLVYVLTKNPDAEHTYTWVERYRDEAALLAHRDSEYMAEAREVLQDVLAEPSRRVMLEQTLPR